MKRFLTILLLAIAAIAAPIAHPGATVSSTGSQVVYTGNGATTAFAVPYPYFTASDIVVTLFNTTSNATVTPAPVLNGSGTYDYQLSGVSAYSYPVNNVTEYTGGTITFNNAPPATYQINITRNVPATQLLNEIDNAKNPSSARNSELDKLTMLIQQQANRTIAALQFPITDPQGLSATLPPAAQRANQAAMFDSLGNAVAGLPTPGGVPVSAAMQPVLAAQTLPLARQAFELSPAQHAVMKPYASQQANAAWDAVDMFGKPIDCTGTTTQCLQEFINYAVKNGQNAELDCPGAATTTQTGTLNGTNIVTGLTSTAGLSVGAPTFVTGPLIPSFTKITSIDSPTQIHISNAATGSATETLTFGTNTVYIGASSSITIPPAEQWSFDAYGCNLTFATTVNGAGLIFDSALITHFGWHGGQIVWQAASPGVSSYPVAIKPTHPVPLDGIIAFASNDVFISNIAAQPAISSATGVWGFDISGGSILNNIFGSDELNGTGQMGYGIEAVSAQANTSFEQNIFDFSDIHLVTIAGIQEGNSATNQTHYGTGNVYRVGIRPNAPAACLSSYGTGSQFYGSCTNEETGGGNVAQGINFASGSAGITATLQLTGITAGVVDNGSNNNYSLNGAVTQNGALTQKGAANFTGTFSIAGVAQSFPASGLLVGTTDSQTLTNKTLTSPAITTPTITDATLNASSAGQFFQTPAGTAGPGTVAVTASSGTVTGTGTSFTKTFQVGETITANSETHTIEAVASDTSMTTDNWVSTASGKSYTMGGVSAWTVLPSGRLIRGGFASSASQAYVELAPGFSVPTLAANFPAVAITPAISVTAAATASSLRGMNLNPSIGASNSQNWTASLGVQGLSIAPSITAGATGTVTGMADLVLSNITNSGSGALTGAAGLLLGKNTAATNNSEIVIGQVTIPTGNFAIFDSSGYPSEFGSGHWAANGAVATSLTSLGPTGSHTTVQEWFTVLDSSGVQRWIPAF